MFFQMSGAFTTPLHELVQHNPYKLIHVGYCTAGMVVTLWDDLRLGGGYLYVVLPVKYEKLFTTRLVLGINNGTKNVQLVIVGFSPQGLPLLEFYGSNLLRYGSMAVRFVW
jgi:hypothetical protein